jgi:hypothetical protein
MNCQLRTYVHSISTEFYEKKTTFIYYTKVFLWVLYLNLEKEPGTLSDNLRLEKFKTVAVRAITVTSRGIKES